MLGFAVDEYRKSANDHQMSPMEFAFHVQRLSVERAASQINEIVGVTGVLAAVVNGKICIRIADDKAARRRLRDAGLSEKEAAELIGHVEEDPSGDWSNFEGLVNQVRKMCGLVLENERCFTETPVVVCALSYFNAGAAPAPSGGNIITLNMGLFESALWPLALERVQEGKRFGLTDQQRREIASLIPHLALVIMEGADAMYRDPALLPVTAAVSSAVGGPRLEVNSLTGFSQAYVLLHEYGHVVRGHTDEIRGWPPTREIMSRPRLDLLARSRDMEFEADGYAAKYSEQIFGGDATRAGMMLFFSLFHTHARFLKQKSLELRTHPTASDRYESAMSYVQSKSAVNDWSSRFQRLTAFLDEIFDAVVGQPRLTVL